MRRLSPSTTLSRRGFVAAAAAAALSLAATPSEAHATTWSAPISRTAQGVAFTARSGLDLAPRTTAHTRASASKTVAAGAMKVRAVIVKSFDNYVIASSSPKKNAKGRSVTASVSLSSADLSVRSRGKASFCGSSYFTCNSVGGRSAAPELAANESGQTLGTWDDAERGAVPDLVAVVADSGAEGYAYWEQFDAEDAPGSIPVYAEDGSTLIGTFTFGDK